MGASDGAAIAGTARKRNAEEDLIQKHITQDRHRSKEIASSNVSQDSTQRFVASFEEYLKSTIKPPKIACLFNSICNRSVQVQGLSSHIVKHLREGSIEPSHIPELKNYLNVSNRWLCMKCIIIYSRRTCNCGAKIGDAVEGIVIFAGRPLPVETAPVVVSEVVEVNLDWKPYTHNTDIFMELRQVQTRTMEYIPSGCRGAFGTGFVKLITEVIANPADLNKWAELYLYPLCVLMMEDTEGQQKKQVNEKLQRWNASPLERKKLWLEVLHYRKKGKKVYTNDHRIQVLHQLRRSMKLIKLGRYRDGLQALNADGIAQINDKVIADLQDKHPVKERPRKLASEARPLKIESEVVSKCIHSFQKGTSPGCDGLRAQHLLDLINVPEQGKDVLSAITSLINLVVSGLGVF